MDAKIQQLCVYLEHLPASLATSDPLISSYGRLSNFAPDDDWLQDIGEEGAVNRELELALGRRDDNNTFPIRERGHCIEALADVLEKYLGLYPRSTLLLNWLDGANASAKQCINTAVSSILPQTFALIINHSSGPRQGRAIGWHACEHIVKATEASVPACRKQFSGPCQGKTKNETEPHRLEDPYQRS